MQRVDIVIVNYRTADLTIDCLRSLAPEMERHPGDRVFVTDNASGDDSVERIGEAIEAEDMRWATLMLLEKNGGFAYGNNAAIRRALGDDDPPAYVLLLNPDTIVRGGAIDALRQFMEAHPQVGIAGSRLEWPDGRGQRSARRFPSIAGEFEAMARMGPVSRLLHRACIAPADPRIASPTDWVVGAAMMIRTEVFNDVGLMDEGYFLYFEEVDFCLAARRAGWPCWYVPESRVVHLVGYSTGVTSAEKRKRCPRFWFESRARYFQKNHGRLTRLLADLAWASGFALHRLRQAFTHSTHTDPPRYLRDFVSFNFLGRYPG